MLDIEVTPSPLFGMKLFNLNKRLRTKWNRTLERTATELYEKVLENLSGKILNVKTDQLRQSIAKEVESSDFDFIAFVGPVPATPKAYALEYGGKGDYVIPVGAKGVLANRETGFFSKRDVLHPPSKEYAYLRTAMEEVEVLLPIELDVALRSE